MNDLSPMPDDKLIAALRQAASIWFKNSDLLLLEELIKRFKKARERLSLAGEPDSDF